jgi:hypothetical protein
MALGVFALSGCWGLASSSRHPEGDSTDEVTATTVPARGLAGLSDCESSWHVLLEQSNPGWNPPTQLVRRDRQLLFGARGTAADSEAQLVAINVDDDLPVPVPLDRGRIIEDLWVENADILFWSRAQLWRISATDSSERLVLDTASKSSPATRSAILLTPDEFFWTASEGAGSLALWRQNLTDPTDRRQIGSLDAQRFAVAHLGRTTDGVLASGSGPAVALSVADGAETPLADVPDGDFAGVDASGVYCSACNRRAFVTDSPVRALELQAAR